MKVAILGGGQLGRMLALDGIPLGVGFRFLEPADSPPAGPVGVIVRAGYEDRAGLDAVVSGVDAVTYEFENVPVSAARHLEKTAPVLPPPAALEMAQDRLVEKQGFEAVGMPTTRFRVVNGAGDVASALETLGSPVVLKTRRFGYDGKGQAVVTDVEEGLELVKTLNQPLIAEAFVAFDRELSLIAVAGGGGERRFYPLTENHHREGILRVSYAPAGGVSPAVQQKAEAYASALIDRLGYVGVLSIEFFQVGEELLANEIAPRVHNSGHWTQDGAPVSQFENHIRAVTGLPLGATTPARPSAMINLIGTVPPAESVLKVPEAHLHLYDKEPRPGRKLGHVNVVADEWSRVLDAMDEVVAQLVLEAPLPGPHLPG